MLIVGACALISWLSHTLKLTDANIVMIFLAGVVLVATRFGHGPAIAAAILSVLTFDYFYVHPSFSFAPTDAQYFITLGAMLGIGLLISELTARLRTELKVSNDAQLQIQAEQLRNALLSSISHDLRTPLAAFVGTATNLLEESTEENWASKREMLQTLADESHRLARLVDNLLDMARLNSGMLVLNRQWHVLEELVGVAVGRVRSELKGHEIRFQIPADFPLLWVADDLFEQMLVNLLENAIRYTPAGSQIEITATCRGDRAEIMVADNGPGLAPGSEERVFDKFFRGTTPVADGRRGVGLGLAICQGIAGAHGGTIQAANRPQGGAQFTISLPIHADPQLTVSGLSEATAGVEC